MAAETGDSRFALNSRLRFLSGFATAITGLDVDGAGPAMRRRGSKRSRTSSGNDGGEPIPDDAPRQLTAAGVGAVFASWDTPRARTYRELHDIPHDLGTAVIVQAMVFGNRDEHSGTGVAFSRDPNTGEHVPFGEVLFGHQGEESSPAGR